MVIKPIILFVCRNTAHKFITAKLSIRKAGSSSFTDIISTDEDAGLRIEKICSNFCAVCGCCTRTDIVTEHLEDTLRICDVSAMGL
jgi:hypothetical protein